ncbi:MAG: TfoX/Sxy family protein [Oscillospiraceae bacterium]|nr:TfoX/Sxy family protein [Oscillospiraceae bacterium]
MTELTTLRYIGKEMERKLKSIGIESAEDLKQIGSKEAFFRMKIHYPQICLVHLYTLQGAIDNIDYNCLSAETKKELKAFSDKLKA